MKHIADISPYPQVNQSGAAIPVKPEIVEVFRMISRQDRELLFINLRLNLQGRILGLSGDDLIKLQGKLEYLTELDKFFTGFVK